MKKVAALVLALMAVAAIALAAGSSLTIKSSQALDKQFQAFRAYLDSLESSDRAAWMAEMAAITAQEQAAGGFSGPASAAPIPERMVWVSKSGRKYHSASTCSNMNSPRQLTREEALRQGFTPCKRCKPQ